MKNRIFGLDLLRVAAIFFVLYGHSYDFIKSYVPYKFYSILLTDGVTLFFVLSGFLIGSILIQLIQNEQLVIHQCIRFFIYRWLRTIPAYFFVLSFLAIIFFIQHDAFPFEVSKYYFFIQNLYLPHPPFFPEAWSLSVEEWFYLLIPLLFFSTAYIFKLPKRRHIVLALISSVLILVTLYRVANTNNVGWTNINDWDNIFRKVVIYRLDAIMFGVLGAYFSFFNQSGWSANKNILFISGVSLALITHVLGYMEIPFFIQYFLLTLHPISVLLMLPFLSLWHKSDSISSKIIVFISLISYSMYLVNYSFVKIQVFSWAAPIYESSLGYAVLSYILFWLLVILISILLHKFIELPFMRLRKRFD